VDFFHTWLPQILGTCELISQEDQLRRAWGEGDLSGTSVYYPGELIEQIFGDWDIEEAREQLSRHLAHRPDLAAAITEFLESLLKLEAWLQAHLPMREWAKAGARPTEAAIVFASDAWRILEERAAKVLKLAQEANYSSSDFYPAS